MILIFDLDDTLFDESTFVTSGMRAVAQAYAEEFGGLIESELTALMALLRVHGRGKVFDLWLQEKQLFTKAQVKKYVKVYRHHKPSIRVSSSVLSLLSLYKSIAPLFMVTDGHKIVQNNKVEALGLRPYFQHIYITHRYGLKASKPSLVCFSHIKKNTKSRWEDMVYVGDNPAKDFVSLNQVGAHTIRLNQGRHALDQAKQGFDAAQTIEDLQELSKALIHIFPNKKEALTSLTV